MSDIRSESIDRFFKVIMSLETIDQCYDFFEDICTIRELREIAQRLDVAILLSEGMNYTKISSKTRVSTATISRVSRCLNYGRGGYKSAIEKLKAGEREDDF